MMKRLIECIEFIVNFMISINLVTNGNYYPINDLQFSIAFIIAQV